MDAIDCPLADGTVPPIAMYDEDDDDEYLEYDLLPSSFRDSDGWRSIQHVVDSHIVEELSRDEIRFQEVSECTIVFFAFGRPLPR